MGRRRVLYAVDFIVVSISLTLYFLVRRAYSIRHDSLIGFDDGNSVNFGFSDWPPLKVYVYPNVSRHTTECLYPKELPTRYIDEKGFWFQRMLEPTVHHQLLSSPLYTDNKSEANLFFIPHYSRMCSGLDNGERWAEIPSLLKESGDFFSRYSKVDHIIMHSVPQYGDKPADRAVTRSQDPIILILDFKWSELRKSPWTFAKSAVVPFITHLSQFNESKYRKHSVFVAMSTKKLAAGSAQLRVELEEYLKKVPKSKIVKINRMSLQSFQEALDSLPENMRASDFCIIPPGDAPSSKRIYDAISHLCIPIIVSDHITLPFDGSFIDYSKILIQVPSKNLSSLSSIIKNKKLSEISYLRRNLRRAKKMFTWDYKSPPKVGESLSSIAWSLYYKYKMIEPYLNNEMTGNDNDPN